MRSGAGRCLPMSMRAGLASPKYVMRIRISCGRRNSTGGGARSHARSAEENSSRSYRGSTATVWGRSQVPLEPPRNWCGWPRLAKSSRCTWSRCAGPVVGTIWCSPMCWGTPRHRGVVEAAPAGPRPNDRHTRLICGAVPRPAAVGWARPHEAIRHKAIRTVSSYGDPGCDFALRRWTEQRSAPARPATRPRWAAAAPGRRDPARRPAATAASPGTALGAGRRTGPARRTAAGTRRSAAQSRGWSAPSPRPTAGRSQTPDAWSGRPAANGRTTHRSWRPAESGGWPTPPRSTGRTGWCTVHSEDRQTR